MTTNLSPAEHKLAAFLFRERRTIAECMKAVGTKHKKTVHRGLVGLHSKGFDVVRRGFEASSDIVYSVEKRPLGYRVPKAFAAVRSR